MRLGMAAAVIAIALMIGTANAQKPTWYVVHLATQTCDATDLQPSEIYHNMTINPKFHHVVAVPYNPGGVTKAIMIFAEGGGYKTKLTLFKSRDFCEDYLIVRSHE